MITVKFDTGDFEAGLKNLAKRLTKAKRAIDGLTVSYGFYSDQHYSGMTVADLARILASGVSFADGQPRDFMQVAANNKDLQNYTMKILRQITKEALKGRTQFTGKLNALGLYAQHGHGVAHAARQRRFALDGHLFLAAVHQSLKAQRLSRQLQFHAPSLPLSILLPSSVCVRTSKKTVCAARQPRRNDRIARGAAHQLHPGKPCVPSSLPPLRHTQSGGATYSGIACGRNPSSDAQAARTCPSS